MLTGNTKPVRTAGLAALVAVFSLVASEVWAASGAFEYLRKPDNWFASDEAKRVAANILSLQSDLGGWPKNTDTTAAPYSGNNRAKDLTPTFDNDATTDELRFLARIYAATKHERYCAAFERGYDYILKAQYPTGGWPQ